MQTQKMANYLLSIAKTTNGQNFLNDEIVFLTQMLNEENPKTSDKIMLLKIAEKYDSFVRKLIYGEKNNRLAKIAIMNNICFYYYENVVLNPEMDPRITRNNILFEINGDIKKFNIRYTDVNFVNKIEKKYINMLKKLTLTNFSEAING